MIGCAYGSIAHWGGGWFGMFALVIIVGVAAYAAARLLDSRGSKRDRRDSLDILKCRLASGEITVEEFETLKRYL